MYGEHAEGRTFLHTASGICSEGASVFAETMASNHFLEILRFLRFDVRNTRPIRLQTNKFALVSDVWNRSVDNCLSCYKSGANITMNEQLFITKALCRFTQHMPKKLNKFDINFWLAVNVENNYILNAAPFLDKNETHASLHKLSNYVIMNLVEPYLGKEKMLLLTTSLPGTA